MITALRTSSRFVAIIAILPFVDIIVAAVIIPLNLLPYLLKGSKQKEILLIENSTLIQPRHKLRAVPWLYFFVIGMAFMMVETRFAMSSSQSS